MRTKMIVTLAAVIAGCAARDPYENVGRDCPCPPDLSCMRGDEDGRSACLIEVGNSEADPCPAGGVYVSWDVGGTLLFACTVACHPKVDDLKSDCPGVLRCSFQTATSGVCVPP